MHGNSTSAKKLGRALFNVQLRNTVIIDEDFVITYELKPNSVHPGHASSVDDEFRRPCIGLNDRILADAGCLWADRLLFNIIHSYYTSSVVHIYRSGNG